MKLIIFGATGTIGHHLVEQALEQGHQVTAFARHPSALGIDHQNLTLFTGDVFNQASVDEAIKGNDAVLVTLGSAKLTGKVRSVGTGNIIKAMERHQVKRLICQSTLGVGDSESNLNFVWKYLMFGLLLRFVFKDHVVQEEMVKQSHLDWTIVRPSAFTDETLTGTIKYGSLPSDKKLMLKIPRLQVAKFMMQQLTDENYLYKTPAVTY